MLHRFESQLEIETVDAFHGRVRDYRYGVITNHRVSLVRRQLPNRQTPALLILREKSLDEIDGALLIDDGVKRMRGAESVPQREDCVVIEAVRLVIPEIASAILPVNVTEQVGCNHRVIQRRVENLALCVAAARQPESC